jgi:type IX secretion system PorP/SprF family membrane protein
MRKFQPITPMKKHFIHLFGRWCLAIVTCIVAQLLPVNQAISQDLHYSQFYGAPLHLNPAMTGVFRGDVRLMANLRRQWANVPVDYRTITGGVDLKVVNSKTRDGFFALGMAYNYDRAGFSQLNLNTLNLNGSYTKKLGKRLYGSLGAQLSLNRRAYTDDDLSFDNQYVPGRGQFDPSRPNGDKVDDDNLTFPSLAGGLNLRYQRKERDDMVDLLTQRTKIDFGVGFFHLNRPNQFFIDNAAIKLPVRMTPYVLGVVQLSKRLDFVGSLAGQYQTTYRQYLAGAGARYYLSLRPGRQFAIQAGMNYRLDANGDATFPAFEALYNNLRVGFSYDINVSEFDVATRGKGGPELFIHYVFTKVKPLPVFKICPLI